MNPKLLASSVAIAFSLLATSSFAALSVDFSSVITDVGTIAAAVIAVLVAIKGAQFVFSLVKRA